MSGVSLSRVCARVCMYIHIVIGMGFKNKSVCVCLGAYVHAMACSSRTLRYILMVIGSNCS